MKTLQTFLFTAFFCLMMVVLGGTIFSVMVEYPNWFADVPRSLETTRTFYKVLHPGYFFQFFGPLTLLSGSAFVLTARRAKPARNVVLIALGILVAIELLTFIYIYPRLNIMFGPDAVSQSTAVLQQAARDFTIADTFRTAMAIVAASLSIAALFKFFKQRYAGTD